MKRFEITLRSFRKMSQMVKPLSPENKSKESCFVSVFCLKNNKLLILNGHLTSTSSSTITVFSVHDWTILSTRYTILFTTMKSADACHFMINCIDVLNLQLPADNDKTIKHLALWVKFSADDILKYFSLFFFIPKKQDLTLHANCLQ